MMRTMKLQEITAWKKRAKTRDDRELRESVEWFAKKNYCVVRLDEASNRVEVIPNPSGAAALRLAGLHGPKAYSFKA